MLVNKRRKDPQILLVLQSIYCYSDVKLFLYILLRLDMLFPLKHTIINGGSVHFNSRNQLIIGQL